jgi:hypothetical protein
MFESSGAQDVELTTRSGYFIKIRPARRTCIIHIDNQPEVVTLSGGRTSMEQPVPYVVFIGPDFVMQLPAGELHLVDNRRGRVAIPYQLSDRSQRFISLSCPSQSDQFPVQVQHYPGVKQFVSREGEGHPYRYVVLDQDIPRIDMVTLKVKNPDARILILKNDAVPEPRPAKRTADELKPDSVRATDLARSAGGSEFSNNPVFNARIHLRNLDFERVKNLLNEFNMSVEEIEFVRTFLGIMIRNDQNKPELAPYREQLQRIDELYRLSGRVIARDQVAFEQELESGIDPVVAEDLARLIARKRLAASNKEEEILYWEWEYRLDKLAEH